MAALVNDPRVEDTHGVDRHTFQLLAPAEPPLAAWQRAVPILNFPFLPAVFHAQNAAAWLCYLFLSLTALGWLVLFQRYGRRWRRAEESRVESLRVLAVLVLCSVTLPQIVLRGPLSARLPDVAPVVAIIGAWMLSEWLSAPARPRATTRVAGQPLCGLPALARSRAPGAVRLAIALAMLAVTTSSVFSVAPIGRHMEQTAIASGPAAVLVRGTAVLELLATTPPAEALAPMGSVGVRGLARYVYECTRPTDRLLVTWFAPELHLYTGRLFAGRHPYYLDGYWASQADQARAVARMAEQRVPVVVATTDGYPSFERAFAVIGEYLRTHYRLAGESTFGIPDGTRYLVLVADDIEPTGTYAPYALPCFR
jgi:hypothetical protein